MYDPDGKDRCVLRRRKTGKPGQDTADQYCDLPQLVKWSQKTDCQYSHLAMDRHHVGDSSRATAAGAHRFDRSRRRTQDRDTYSDGEDHKRLHVLPPWTLRSTGLGHPDTPRQK